MKDNIISVNLLKSNANSNVYGIDNLLKLSLGYLKKDNPFDDKIFDEMENIKNSLEKIEDGNEIKRKDYELLAHQYLNQISKENSLLSGCTNINEILKKAKFDANLSIYYASFIFFFMIHWLNYITRIERYIDLFKKIENCYKIFTDEISIYPLISEKDNILIFEGFYIIDQSKKNKDIDLEKLEKKKNIFFNLNSSSEIIIGKIKLSINGEIFRENYNMSFIDVLFGDQVIKFFSNYVIAYLENYIKKQYCIDYIIKQKNIYKNIFDEIEEMSKNNWEKFHPQII